MHEGEQKGEETNFSGKYVELEKYNIPNNAKVTVAASQTASFRNGTIGEGAKFDLLANVKNQEDVALTKEYMAKARALISQKEQGMQQFGSSKKIIFLLGKSTYVETYTPDSDGITRDLHHNTIQSGGSLCRFYTPNPKQGLEDVQSAVNNPDQNYRVYNVTSMR